MRPNIQKDSFTFTIVIIVMKAFFKIKRYSHWHEEAFFLLDRLRPFAVSASTKYVEVLTCLVKGFLRSMSRIEWVLKTLIVEKNIRLRDLRPYDCNIAKIEDKVSPPCPVTHYSLSITVYRIIGQDWRHKSSGSLVLTVTFCSPKFEKNPSSSWVPALSVCSMIVLEVPLP